MVALLGGKGVDRLAALLLCGSLGVALAGGRPGYSPSSRAVAFRQIIVRPFFEYRMCLTERSPLSTAVSSLSERGGSLALVMFGPLGGENAFG